MLLIYDQIDRSFLSHNRILYLILRTTFQTLAQARMVRINSKTQFDRLENIITNLEGSVLNHENTMETMKRHLDPHTGHLHNSINQLKIAMIV